MNITTRKALEAMGESPDFGKGSYMMYDLGVVAVLAYLRDVFMSHVEADDDEKTYELALEVHDLIFRVNSDGDWRYIGDPKKWEAFARRPRESVIR